MRHGEDGGELGVEPTPATVFSRASSAPLLTDAGLGDLITIGLAGAKYTPRTAETPESHWGVFSLMLDLVPLNTASRPPTRRSFQ